MILAAFKAFKWKVWKSEKLTKLAWWTSLIVCLEKNRNAGAAFLSRGSLTEKWILEEAVSLIFF